MKKLNGSIHTRTNKRDIRLLYHCDKVDKHLNVSDEIEYDPFAVAQVCGVEHPQRRAKYKAYDTYWKDFYER
jgi:hypothetical protein